MGGGEGKGKGGEGEGEGKGKGKGKEIFLARRGVHSLSLSQLQCVQTPVSCGSQCLRSSQQMSSLKLVQDVQVDPSYVSRLNG